MRAAAFALAVALAAPASAIEPYEVRTLELHVNDLVWHAASGRLLASAAADTGPLANSLVEIDPLSGALGAPVALGSEPVRLALSGDGSLLYVGLDSAGAVRPLALPGLVPGDAWPLPADPQYGRQFAADLAVQPGSPSVVAVVLHRNIQAPRSGGVMIFDGGVARPDRVTQAIDQIEFSDDPSALFGHGDSDDFYQLQVDAQGATLVDETAGVIAGLGVAMRFVSGRLYSTMGRVFEPIRPSYYGTYPPTFKIVADVAVDASAGLLYFLEEDGIAVYDLARFVRLVLIPIPELSRDQGSLVLWRSGGLAFRSGSRVVLVDATLPDGDGDSHANARDNCWTAPNTSQYDEDGDRVGEACDPDDEAAEPALAVCDDKIQVFVDRLYACLVGSGFEDSDGDDEHDPGDHCPQTPALASVDDAGCSLEQFCVVQGDVCASADWRNDEPKGKPRDCARVGSKRAGYSCHAVVLRGGGK